MDRLLGLLVDTAPAQRVLVVAALGLCDDAAWTELAEEPLDIGTMVAFAHVSAALAALKGAAANGGRS